jgi:peptidoglycan/xylan/chitin deacetylase (PgdA/CDA1 family)
MLSCLRLGWPLTKKGVIDLSSEPPAKRWSSKIIVTAPSIKSTRILAYHGVHPKQIDGITHEPAEFERQMQFFAARGVRIVSLSSLCEEGRRLGRWPDKVIALTFDDGYSDCTDFALPILKGLGFTATVFVITDTLMDNGPRPLFCPVDKEFLSKAQLYSLINEGWELGSHTCNHARLPGLQHSERVKQIFESKHILEAYFGTPVNSFCYPAGNLCNDTTELVRDAGYRQAVVTPWNADLVNPLDWFTLERVGFYPGDHLKFYIKTSPLFHWLRRFGFLVRGRGENA